ncbi:hypothetical protein ANCDUO_10845 [Ancylostoma duodenale]|uniref:Uncharacterized protein n=1 Tax=Ancylostoma duodenale TaxID=51022 RepID=A0A0C2CQB2_9BILA|nr:hypothetical protein ANCDUO_10845 [Ancylostoma duodenale]
MAKAGSSPERRSDFSAHFNVWLWRWKAADGSRIALFSSNLFNLIRSQFGCGSYSDDTDRILAPNVIMIVSDNFA